MLKRKARQTIVVETTNAILLSEKLLREIPTGHVDQHHDQVETGEPELGGMVLASLKEIIQFDSLVASL